MKGIVFTEFLEMVEKKFGYDMVDSILEKSGLDGIYTAIGTYPHHEIVSLLMNLSEETNKDAEILLSEFGKYIFDTFLASYPQFFQNAENAFEFLESIDNHIHVEVQKLYPEAALPRFETEVNAVGEMTMVYKSDRKMSSFAMGLIEKTISHYKENLNVTKEVIKDDGSEVRFIIAPA